MHPEAIVLAAKAVVGSLSRSGRLVTSAAMILAVSSFSLTTNPDLPVPIIATGLAFGILLDAFVIRTLLVPALVALFGRWSWWIPEGFARVLGISRSPPGPLGKRTSTSDVRRDRAVSHRRPRVRAAGPA
jgi:RND superfamily putative drug exporter